MPVYCVQEFIVLYNITHIVSLIASLAPTLMVLLHRLHIGTVKCRYVVRPDFWFRPHDGVIKRKDFSRYWPFVRGIHRLPVNFPHKGQWRGALMFSLICTGINGWINNHEAGDLRCHRVHFYVIVMNLQAADRMLACPGSNPENGVYGICCLLDTMPLLTISKWSGAHSHT